MADEPRLRATGFGRKPPLSPTGAPSHPPPPSGGESTRRETPSRFGRIGSTVGSASSAGGIPDGAVQAGIDAMVALAAEATAAHETAERLRRQIAETHAQADRAIAAITDPPGAVGARELAGRLASVANARNRRQVLEAAKNAARADETLPDSPETASRTIDELFKRMRALVEPGIRRPNPQLFWWWFPGTALKDFYSGLRSVELLASHHKALTRGRIETRRRERVSALGRETDAARRAWLTARDSLRSDWESASMTLEAEQPSFANPVWDAPVLPDAPRRWIRVGTARLGHADAPWTMPMLWRCPSGRPLVIPTAGAARAVSARLVMLITRILAGLPAGAAEMTLIDPIGLSDTFKVLAPIRDYDKRLLGERVLVESRDIEEALADLTRKIAEVNTAYLGSSFGTLEEHNASAGTSAAPYRIVVIADFPERFSAEAIKRLTTIAAQGPAAGVILVVHHNRSAELPYGADLTALYGSSVSLDDRQIPRWPTWDQLETVTAPGIAVHGAEAYEVHGDDGLELRIEASVSATRFGRIIEALGSGTSSSRDKTVPMGTVLKHLKAQIAASPGRFEGTPPIPDVEDPGTWWHGSSADGIVLPLGPASARSTQSLILGRKGTEHHVLVAGVTGSGKSTLLRTLISVGAMIYSPDELRFALIDFRNGVGFEVFASDAHPLVHADTIVVDCEREKGVHLLDGLIEEMHRRERAIRAVTAATGSTVDDIAKYRTATGKKMPRIMIIADEFQFLTGAEDSVARAANDRLEILAKQGRASGLHLLLASQSIKSSGLDGGVKSQAAVRVGLQLRDPAESEALFADGNTAAAAISQPGGAIMNTSPSRTIETNQPFTVGMSDEAYMKSFLAGLALRGKFVPRTTRVLDGTGPTSFVNSLVLERLLGRPLRAASPASSSISPPPEGGTSPTRPRLRHSFGAASRTPAPKLSATGFEAKAVPRDGSAAPRRPTPGDPETPGFRANFAVKRPESPRNDPAGEAPERPPAPTEASEPDDVGSGRDAIDELPIPMAALELPAFTDPLAERPRAVGVAPAELGSSARRVLDVPVAIGDPTSLRAPDPTVLERMSGANILHVGGGESAALGVAAGLIVSWIHALGTGEGPAVSVLDALREADSDEIRRAVDAGAGERVRWVRGRAIEPAILALDAACAARRESDEEQAPHLIVILGLQRTDLKPNTIGFAPLDEVTPRQAFERLVSDGPRVGLHVAIWTDTANSASKFIDHVIRGEFGFLLGHRMSETASEVLFSSRAAAGLADGRAAWRAQSGDTEVLSVLVQPDGPTLTRLVHEELARP
jgi:hypothetical protein